MIRFHCRCKHSLAVPDEQAGGTVQCRRCGRLNDVPSINDADHIDDDGAYKLDDDRPAAAGHSARDHRRQTVELLRDGGRDERGESRDLRLNIDEFLRIGSPTDPNLDADGIVPDRPHYDPLTGELVRPLDLKRDPPTPARPVKVEPIDDGDLDALDEIAAVNAERGATADRRAAAAPPSQPASRRPGGPKLTYANRATDPTPRVPPSRVPIELFKPQNVAVMGFVVLGHAIVVYPLGLLGGAMAILMFPVIVILLLLLAGHYGNVVEETGPLDRDELPTPMRGLSFGDDIWNPALNTLGAAFTCFGPAMLVFLYAVSYDPMFRGKNGPVPAVDLNLVRAVAAALAAAGSLLFPAALLTATTAGSALLNLAPHRLVGTARACGRGYVVSLGLMASTALVYALGIRGIVGKTALPFGWTPPGVAGEVVRYALGLPALCVGVYLGHLFCWHLGLMYRAHHARFPWLFQKWEPTRTDTMKQLELRRAAIRAKAAEALRDRRQSVIAGVPTGKRAPQRVLPVD